MRLLKKILIFNIVVFIFLIEVPAQSVSGTFSSIIGKNIKLVGFSGFDKYLIDSTEIDEKGHFSLNFSKKDCGMGLLVSEENSMLVVLAENEDLKLQGLNFESIDSIKMLKGKQNQWFARYASEHPDREQTLTVWAYLEKIYDENPHFSGCEAPKQAIAAEMKRIAAEDSIFLAKLPETYVKWYLPFRRLVSETPAIAQYRTDEIPSAVKTFRNIDYCDSRLQKSGLLADLIENHFWLIENSGVTLDSVYAEMKISIDEMIDNLSSDEKILNEVTEYLFDFLEKRSLFQASEYLALKLLNEQGCTLDDDFSSQLESYRAMKKGNTAPDFDFDADIAAPNYGTTPPKRLSALKDKYIVVIFGASWCPKCPSELLKISQLYNKWRSLGAEVVFVSLDEDEKTFKSFTKIFPFVSVCDYKKWDSPIVEKYFVFATPTIYLLDDKREILLRPNSASQLDAWFDWNLSR